VDVSCIDFAYCAGYFRFREGLNFHSPDEPRRKTALDRAAIFGAPAFSIVAKSASPVRVIGVRLTSRPAKRTISWVRPRGRGNVNAILRDWQAASLHVFCFLSRSCEESSELTNVGALKIAETLQQSDAMTKQSFITFRCSRLFFDVARLLVERPDLIPQFVGHFQSCSKFIGLRPKYRRSLAGSLPSFPLVHHLFILSRADSEFRCRTEDSTAIHDRKKTLTVLSVCPVQDQLCVLRFQPDDLRHAPVLCFGTPASLRGS
jgi:hypothetical protein